MRATRKQQITWWALKVYKQANEYADIADPKRTFRDPIASKLDRIRVLANALHIELTGKPI